MLSYCSGCILVRDNDHCREATSKAAVEFLFPKLHWPCQTKFRNPMEWISDDSQSHFKCKKSLKPTPLPKTKKKTHPKINKQKTKKTTPNQKSSQNYLEKNMWKMQLHAQCAIVANYRSQPLFLLLWCFQIGETTKLSVKQLRVYTNSTVNFRRHDPINTTPVFLAGDPFLTSKHQGEKRNSFLFPL